MKKIKIYHCIKKVNNKILAYLVADKIVFIGISRNIETTIGVSCVLMHLREAIFLENKRLDKEKGSSPLPIFFYCKLLYKFLLPQNIEKEVTFL